MPSSTTSSPSKKQRTSPAKESTQDILEKKCIDTIRVLSADIVEKANSGHPGAPMGCAPIAHALFGDFMNYSSSDPKFHNRDRFVLSNGHACALVYSMLHLSGYSVSIQDLMKFRQLGSITPGHPENFATPGIEVSTGPLGQGISNAVGLCIAEKHLAATFNRDGLDIVDHFTYVICGDGCLQEGVSAEASSLAGHLGLGKLIVCYDDNRITIDGDTSLSFTEDVSMRYEAYGWHVQTVDDVNDIHALKAAIHAAKAESSKPSMIKIRTIIGFGSSKEGSHSVHGAPLGAADLSKVKEKFGFNTSESFVVPSDVQEFYATKGKANDAIVQQWNDLFSIYKEKFPELAKKYLRQMAGELSDDWKQNLPVYTVADKAVATRNRSEEVLNVCCKYLDEIIGGSADLTPSNLTSIKCSSDFQKNTPAGRHIRFGVREHAMAAICNGIFAHGGLRPYCATFMNFIGYALGAVRLSALSKFGVIYVMTHDSIGLGEDGPTHQPVEMLEYLRSTPNLFLIRPADGNETVGAYVTGIEHKSTPTVISLSRQATPTIDGTSAEKVSLGAYTVLDLPNTSDSKSNIPSIILIGTGTELALAISTANKLHETGSLSVRVVSMPCWELFEMQTIEYQLSVFPDGSPVMSIEASGSHGWRKYAHAPFGLTTYGLSAPAPDLYNLYGFTVSNLTDKAIEVVEFYKSRVGGAPSLLLYPKFNVKQNDGHH